MQVGDLTNTSGKVASVNLFHENMSEKYNEYQHEDFFFVIITHTHIPIRLHLCAVTLQKKVIIACQIPSLKLQSFIE